MSQNPLIADLSMKIIGGTNVVEGRVQEITDTLEKEGKYVFDIPLITNIPILSNIASQLTSYFPNSAQLVIMTGSYIKQNIDNDLVVKNWLETVKREYESVNYLDGSGEITVEDGDIVFSVGYPIENVKGADVFGGIRINRPPIGEQTYTTKVLDIPRIVNIVSNSKGEGDLQGVGGLEALVLKALKEFEMYKDPEWLKNEEHRDAFLRHVEQTRKKLSGEQRLKDENVIHAIHAIRDTQPGNYKFKKLTDVLLNINPRNIQFELGRYVKGRNVNGKYATIGNREVSTDTADYFQAYTAVILKNLITEGYHLDQGINLEFTNPHAFASVMEGLKRLFPEYTFIVIPLPYEEYVTDIGKKEMPGYFNNWKPPILIAGMDLKHFKQN